MTDIAPSAREFMRIHGQPAVDAYLPIIQRFSKLDKNTCTVMRYWQNKKSFALIMCHGGELYLNLKYELLEADFLRSVYKNIIPGYHMNKTHWNTVIIGEDVPGDAIKRMIDRSYDLIKPKTKIKNRNRKEETK